MNLLHALLLPLTLALTWLYALTTRTAPPRNKRITLLIAHPDDEAMFFAPTLLALAKPALNNTLSVICLSTGNADGIGHLRSAELVDSCARLGVPADRVTAIDHPELQDQMHSPWPATTIAHVLREHHRAAASLPHMLITFDERGVSGHPNHVSCLRGAQEWLPHDVELWVLGTVGLARKYLFVLDGVVQALVGGAGAGAGTGWLFVSSAGEVRVAREAMVHAHRSQMRWFRWGWIGLSRYMVVNGLERAR